jgi:tRNA-modifying protein YgfZ
MIPAWKEFLVNAGAELSDEQVASFGNPDLELRVVTTGNVICDLSHFGLLAIRGEDAPAFLQGQLTSDVRQISATQSQLTAMCSPKGRMLMSGRLFRRGDDFYLRLPDTMLAPVLNRLRMFVLRAKVVLEDAGGELVRMGLSGPGAEAELRDALGAVPLALDEGLQTGAITALRIPGPHPRFELYGPVEPMRKLWSVLDVRTAPVGMTPWRLLDVLAGVPNVYPQTADAFVPQMANYELIGGVSFSKGCYTGQEVVARSHYLGKVKRRMYRARVDTDTSPLPGDELHAPATESGQSAGKIVDASPHPDGGYEVLAVVQCLSAEGQQVRLGGPDGPVLHFAALPYGLEPTESGSGT